MPINKDRLQNRNDAENVVKALIKNTPVQSTQKEPKIMVNFRISEKLRDDFRELCFRQRTDMTAELIAYIEGRVEKGT